LEGLRARVEKHKMGGWGFFEGKRDKEGNIRGVGANRLMGRKQQEGLRQGEAFHSGDRRRVAFCTQKGSGSNEK